MTVLVRASIAVLALWTLGYFVIGTEAIKRLRASHNLPQQAPQKAHPWVILRPTHGQGFSRPAAHLVPITSAPMRVIYLAAANDPLGQANAREAVALLASRGVIAECLVTEPGGLNGKAYQLAQVPQAKLEGAYVLSLDDDIDPATVNLDAAAAALDADEQLAAVWLPYRADAAALTLADRIAASAYNAGPHAFVLLAALAPKNLGGKILAYRPAAVTAVGGWGPRARYYGDDIDLGQALGAAGYHLAALACCPASMTRAGQSFGDIWQRQHRWARIIIDQNPQLAPSYVFYMGAAPLLLAGWSVVMLSPPAWPWAAAGLTATAVARARLLYALQPPSLVQLSYAWVTALAADTFLLATFFAALVWPDVTWHGRTARVQNKG